MFTCKITLTPEAEQVLKARIPEMALRISANKIKILETQKEIEETRQATAQIELEIADRTLEQEQLQASIRSYLPNEPPDLPPASPTKLDQVSPTSTTIPATRDSPQVGSKRTHRPTPSSAGSSPKKIGASKSLLKKQRAIMIPPLPPRSNISTALPSKSSASSKTQRLLVLSTPRQPMVAPPVIAQSPTPWDTRLSTSSPLAKSMLAPPSKKMIETTGAMIALRVSKGNFPAMQSIPSIPPKTSSVLLQASSRASIVQKPRVSTAVAPPEAWLLLIPPKTSTVMPQPRVSKAVAPPEISRASIPLKASTSVPCMSLLVVPSGSCLSQASKLPPKPMSVPPPSPQ
ncbi:hypothetical protein B0H11DRAFT_1939754 [Mycena galericulata]|nr:hypothetical protein B0H11DRAFT_1939754 [Mycena galericulata]